MLRYSITLSILLIAALILSNFVDIDTYNLWVGFIATTTYLEICTKKGDNNDK